MKHADPLKRSVKLQISNKTDKQKKRAEQITNIRNETG